MNLFNGKGRNNKEENGTCNPHKMMLVVKGPIYPARHHCTEPFVTSHSHLVLTEGPLPKGKDCKAKAVAEGTPEILEVRTLVSAQ